MRFFYLLVLVVLVGAVGLFVWQNQTEVPLKFVNANFSWEQRDLPLAYLVGAAYLLGMLTGWTVLGIFRRSLRRATEAPPPEQRAPAYYSR